MVGVSEKQGKCGKFREISNQKPGFIFPGSASCKYYKPNQKERP